MDMKNNFKYGVMIGAVLVVACMLFLLGMNNYTVAGKFANTIAMLIVVGVVEGVFFNCLCSHTLVRKYISKSGHC